MPYIVRINYTHPDNKPWPPGPDMRFDVPLDIQLLRKSFLDQGKILATDVSTTPLTFTVHNTTTFASEESYLEWFDHPVVKAFFMTRDQFLETKGIVKEKTMYTV